MKIVVKLNLLLLVLFGTSLAATYAIAKQLLEINARTEVQDNARIMMRSALAVRSYTVSQIKPLLDGQNHYKFLPQTVPSYAATEYFENLRASFPEYSYKEATLNPTNPRDRAVEWEIDVVNHFRQNPAATELVGEHDSALGRALYFAQPLRIADPACLVCHSTVAAAPQTMLDMYGNANGFNWKPGEIVGAQVVSVPYAVAIERAHAVLTRIVYLLGGLFLTLFLALNLVLKLLVFDPMRTLATIADAVSLGNMDAPAFPTAGRDEMTTLGRSFNRMRRSLVEALQMLEK